MSGTSRLRIAVAGAGGRMGRAILRAIAEAPAVQLTAALVSPGSAVLHSDAGVLAGCGTMGVTATADPAAALRGADAVIDFSKPAASVALAELAASLKVAAVIGTTGFSGDEERRIEAAARRTAIVKSGNMSLGVTLLSSLVQQAAKSLPGFDIEIVEMHHRMKADAPSGTALLLGKAVAEGRQVSLDDVRTDARKGLTGPRANGSIGFASLRGGTVVGEHAVIFAGPHERLTLSHVAEDRSIFARGALAAARWAHGKPAGLYSMRDVLGLSR